jgi:hypothetical protein
MPSGIFFERERRRENSKYSTIIVELIKMRLQPSTSNHTAFQLNPYGGAIVERNFLSSNTVKEHPVLVGFRVCGSVHLQSLK